MLAVFHHNGAASNGRIGACSWRRPSSDPKNNHDPHDIHWLHRVTFLFNLMVLFKFGLLSEICMDHGHTTAYAASGDVANLIRPDLKRPGFSCDPALEKRPPHICSSVVFIGILDRHPGIYGPSGHGIGYRAVLVFLILNGVFHFNRVFADTGRSGDRKTNPETPYDGCRDSSAYQYAAILHDDQK